MNPKFEMRAAIPDLEKWYGLLSGPLYYVSFAVSGIFWGIACQKHNRIKLLTIAGTLWSVATLGIGAISGSGSIWALAALRIVAGVTQSGALPAMYTLIDSYFSSNFITTANSLLSASSYLGASLSSLTLVGIKQFGW